MDCLSDRAAPHLWGTKPRAAETRVENKKQTGGFGDQAVGSKLLNLFSGTFVLCRTSNGEAIFHPPETLGSRRIFFISPKTPARNRSGDGEIREGWQGRWEEERRGVMDESERWEATRRPSSVCEFLLEPMRPRRTSSPSYKRRTRVCPCEVQAGTSQRKNRTNPQHRISNTSSILLSPAKFDYRVK